MPEFDSRSWLLVFIIAAGVIIYLVRSLRRDHSPREILAMLSGRTSPGREICGIEVAAGTGFRFEHAKTLEGPLGLYLTYDIAYEWNDEDYPDDESAYGVWVRGTFLAGQGPGHAVEFGFGAFRPGDVQGFTGISHGAVYRRNGSSCSYRVTVPLVRAEKLAAGMETVFSGTINQSPNIRRSRYRLFLTR